MSKKRSSQDFSSNHMEEAKQKRKEAFAAKSEDKQKKTDVKSEFKNWFLAKCAKNQLKKELENVIWLHFLAYKFDNKDKFELGLKHFGI